MTNGHPDGNGSIRLSRSVLSWLGALAVIAGAVERYVSLRAEMILLRADMTAAVEARREMREDVRVQRITADSLRGVTEQLRARLNTILTDHERRLDNHDRLHGIPPNAPLPK